MRGLASDGGLFMPQFFPKLKKEFFKKIYKIKFEEIVFNVIGKFVVDIPGRELKKIIKDALNFPAPLIFLNKDLYILELFHGPTLSFKDFGARFMARVLNYYASKSGQKFSIITATSGDTGGAVASAFYNLPNIKVYILYPTGRISGLQEKQIATLGGNVTALEVTGDFDDCQYLAKSCLADEGLRKKIDLSSANSINIGRLLPQMFYYFYAWAQFLKFLKARSLKKVVFVVPSGNFGNLTAGLFAKKIGLPAKKFIAAVNTNSVIPSYLKRGLLSFKKTLPTFSSAMDVAMPSNWERILDLYGRKRSAIKKDLEAQAVTDAETGATIKNIYNKYGYVLDPHTAVGVCAAEKSGIAGPKIVLSTAHPAKFPEIINKFLKRKITLPKELRAIVRKNKKSVKLSNNFFELKKFLLKQ